MEEGRQALGAAKRLVIKIGSAVITHEGGQVDEPVLMHLAEQVVGLTRAGKQVVLVTSGAIRAGLDRLGIRRRVRDLPTRQAAAAVGQIELIWRYREVFGRLGQPIAQILLTQNEFSDFSRYLHLRNTLFALLGEHKVVPVLNENDPVSAEGVQIGENDRLAAVVASKIEADLLLSLSDVAGYYSGDPRQPGAELISEVTEITPEMEAWARGSAGPAGRGGMRAKLDAAKLATAAGVTMVIAAGKEPHVISRILAGERVGTVFLPGPSRVRAKKRWIGWAGRPVGSVVVDEGAAQAICERGSSLLPVGVREVRGDFRPGDIVSVLDPTCREIARGLVNFPAEDVRKIQGCHTSHISRRLGHRDFDEVIHRDNLVVL